VCVIQEYIHNTAAHAHNTYNACTGNKAPGHSVLPVTENFYSWDAKVLGMKLSYPGTSLGNP